MAKVPPAPGWKADDWRAWFEELVERLRGVLLGLRDDPGADSAALVH